VVFAADALALLAVAVSEEVVFRGYLLRALAAWRGPLVGVLATSVLFALVHSLNPNLNGLALLNLALAGVLLALAVERTGALWLAIAYHFAWNLTEGSILGMPVSGMAWNGLLTTIRPSGPALLTGGLFGPEGGLVATAILLLSLLPLWALTRRPAAVVASCRRQRAEVERRFGPLPTLHIRLDPGAGLFDEFRQGIRRGDRQGEVVLLLLRADGSCLLHTKSFYPDGAYRLPSGGIHLAESVLDAARRETAEETGLMLGALRPLGLLTYCLQHRAGTEATPLRPAPGGHGGPRPDGRRMFFHSWIVLGDVTGEAVASDAGEQISGFRWVPLTDLPSLATALLELAPPWDGWGRFRAPAHTAALQWL
jgi:8-oxo-dGTP pyrophosphatase MutT (NUDIX family)